MARAASHRPRPGVLVFELAEDADLADARQLQACATEQALPLESVVVDASALRYSDSRILSVLVELHLLQARHGGRFVVVTGSGYLGELLRAANLADVLESHRSLDEALAALEAPRP